MQLQNVQMFVLCTCMIHIPFPRKEHQGIIMLYAQYSTIMYCPACVLIRKMHQTQCIPLSLSCMVLFGNHADNLKCLRLQALLNAVDRDVTSGWGGVKTYTFGMWGTGM